MQHLEPERLTLVVMAKPAVPGRVKTRLIGDRTPEQAARIHAAMLACVLDRLTHWLPDSRRVLALAGGASGAATGCATPPGWRLMDQGSGDLGQRLEHVWRSLGGGAVGFLGVDSPDVPAAALQEMPIALREHDVAVGPAEDGGYWTLLARRFDPCLVRAIDWGTPAVYDQTRSAAAQAGLRFRSWARWHDVDTPSDLAGLRTRLEVVTEPALVRLRDRLQAICEVPPP